MFTAGGTPGQPSEGDIQASTERIRDALRQLRLDDMAALALKQHNERGPVVVANPSWSKQSILNLKSYLMFLVMTWAQTFRSILFSRKLDFGDRVSVLVFALGASVVLFLAFWWCLITTSPLVEWLYSISRLGREGGNIDWVNSMNPKLYQNLTPEQSAAARLKLGQAPDPNARNPRFFDLDVARLLLQISALMYERSHLDTILAVQTMQRSLNLQSLTLNSARERAAQLAHRANSVPGRLFEQLVRHNDRAPPDGVQSAARAAAASNHQDTEAHLLQDDNSSAPTVMDVVNAADEASRGMIDIWASAYGVAFEPVSELASLSKASCSVFWEPKSTWIVVAFKYAILPSHYSRHISDYTPLLGNRGTDLRWFEEWAIDFTATFFDMSREIPTFNYVHDGFKERLFPVNATQGERRPWDTIAASIQIVTRELARIRPPGTLIDVWFTGHSLGSGMGSLAYAKALLSRADLGPYARLRDAYMFAAPVTVDVASRRAFNSAVHEENDIPRTLWRITNRNDAVATGLPALGDSDKYPYNPDNLFFFSHIGVGLHLQSTPSQTQVEGNHITRAGQDPLDLRVHISSSFTADELRQQRATAERQGLTISRMYSVLQNIPLVGRLLAHAPPNYYDQLDKLALGQCIDKR
ncbi:hypothetical protein FRC04_010957 [Tulasnella sp. 424]|nr:hypothetical protein FRC04_010957 [Tulasnella sp. 424]KAG8972117.1 hypothetical protein FRC05_010285 [Tulasnella sp. 425]